MSFTFEIMSSMGLSTRSCVTLESRREPAARTTQIVSVVMMPKMAPVFWKARRSFTAIEALSDEGEM